MNTKHFFKSVFWIATFSGCLQASPIPNDSRVGEMRTNVTCDPNSTFYAPEHVKAECITTALDCVMRELNGTVKVECNDTMKYIDQEIEYLEIVIKKRLENKHPLNSSECPCEKWSQTPFSEFLNKMETLYQLRNTASSS